MKLKINKQNNDYPKNITNRQNLKNNDVLLTNIDNEENNSEVNDIIDIKELFSDYNGNFFDVKPFLFESKGNEKW